MKSFELAFCKMGLEYLSVMLNVYALWSSFFKFHTRRKQEEDALHQSIKEAQLAMERMELERKKIEEEEKKHILEIEVGISYMLILCVNVYF